MLLGRHSEREQLDGLPEAARGGHGAALVIRGEPGIGKSALLDYLADTAVGLRVSRVAGVEPETELPFAGLQHLCAPILDGMGALPAPQRDALATAFGLRAGTAPSPFLLGLAVLSLLSEAGRRQPVLCLVDDAQWQDRESAKALAIAARRLQADAVAMVFATREPAREFTGLPELVVGGLSDADARGLLDSVPGRMDERVRDRIVAEARGNPLALLELPRAVAPAELAGGFTVPESPAPGRVLELSFGQRYAALPGLTRQLLTVAAAEPTGDPVLLWRAAGTLGIAAEAAAAAEADGLVTFGTRVIFRHPMVRSVVYRASPLAVRRAAHQALAQSTDTATDPDRSAWHRAQAAAGPDEEIAVELERSADRAQSCGGLAAAAAFLERSAALTVDPARRSARSLAAAQAKQQAGAFTEALRLLRVAEGGPPDPARSAQADLLRGKIAFAQTYGQGAPPLLLDAARRLEPLDVRAARETYLEAIWAGLLAGRLASGVGLAEIAKAARGAPPPTGSPRPADLLLDGLALLVTDGSTAAVPLLKKAVRAFRDQELPAEDEVRWLWLACAAAGLVWDYDGWDVLSARLVRRARHEGALTVLPIALSSRAGFKMLGGELGAASMLGEEQAAVSDVTSSQLSPYGPLGVAAYRGDEGRTLELMATATRDVLIRGEGVGLANVQLAGAVLYNGLGRYQDALDWALQATADSDAQRFTGWALCELIEAATRTGEAGAAADALHRLSVSTQASGTDWALGTETCVRALLSNGPAAESLYLEAVSHLSRTRVRPALARAHLLYGEWLRRNRRRLDARDQLRRAHEMCTSMGMEGFAARARAELAATGERARKRTSPATNDLTPQEAQISRLAASGATNAEIAARLFISASTVEYHLGKAFRKLGVTSRTRLARRLLQEEHPPGH